MDCPTPTADLLAGNIIAVAERYCTARGIVLTTLSQYAARDREFIPRIQNGLRKFSVGTYDQALQYMSDTWPDGAVWPIAVNRPKPRRPAAKEI